MTDGYSLMLYFYMYALKCADANQPTTYYSRIGSALLPAIETYE